MKNVYFIRLFIAGIVLIGTVFAIYGFYPVKFLDMEFVPLLQRIIIDFSYIAFIFLALLCISTILCGRFYCSMLCPLGIIQEFVSIIYNKLFKNKNKQQKNLSFKYIVAAITFGTLAGGSVILMRYIEPYTVFGSFVSLSIYGIIAVFIILLLVFFKNRFFCTNICPLGAILGLISKISINKIYIDKENCISCRLCEKECPSGCINAQEKTIDNEICVKCLKCFTKCKKMQ